MHPSSRVRLTFTSLVEMVNQITLEGLDIAQVAAAYGVTEGTARKWLGRYLEGGVSALANPSSRSFYSNRSLGTRKALRIFELRKRQMSQADIALKVGVSQATVYRVLTRAGMSKVSKVGPVDS